MTLPHQSSIQTSRDVHKARARHHHLKFEKQLSRDQLSESINLKKIASKKSTQDSDTSELVEPLKKRPKKKSIVEIHEALKKIRHF